MRQCFIARVLAIPDLHAPFQHPRAYEFLEKVYFEYECNRVVSLGDEVDMAGLSRFPHDPDGLSPGYELKAAIEELKPLFRLFPKVDVCTSNHTSRPFRKAFEAGIPRAYIRHYGDFLKAPSGWVWHDFIEIDKVRYFHGEGFNGQSAHINAARQYRQSVVIGHIHSFAGINYLQGPNDRLFGMNAGCLIDDRQYPFQYAKHIANRPMISCGVILEGVPFLIPMPPKMAKIK